MLDCLSPQDMTEWCLGFQLPYLIKCKILKCLRKSTNEISLAAKHSPCHCPLPLSNLQCIKRYSSENKYFYCYRKLVLQLELFNFLHFLHFHFSTNMNGPLINIHRFSDLHLPVSDLRIPLRDKRTQWKVPGNKRLVEKADFTLCLFQIIKYKWPGTKVMQIEVAVPSFQLQG